MSIILQSNDRSRESERETFAFKKKTLVFARKTKVHWNTGPLVKTLNTGHYHVTTFAGKLPGLLLC